MPKPKRLGDIVVWDQHQLDLVLEALPDDGEVNPWDVWEKALEDRYPVRHRRCGSARQRPRLLSAQRNEESPALGTLGTPEFQSD